ncbi:hypothetical protein G3N55_08820 [Dissulfurirhabdus thermomarina]|uniref:Glycosyltransferase RgtA/B/C/D-like domain-containing protein n=1 Tax=Dissulfurirhabdus thermomarina TaxID=1765737 RepID=A0A6N9TNS4_DISTH|nr:glycosyltransferase family 39 protein [Dissulfurirhabdus thermomarina]NDY42942.1 hypothetical protein [Dissulfurirhabdus thermomarina]NMX22895.1 hypothetical protein [Dissulfurirhabdus thermomarina]
MAERSADISPRDGRRVSAAAVLFWAAAVVVLFWGLGGRALWGPEGRWAEIVREMFLAGDFFHPRLNGFPYFDKPLFSYWGIALASVVTGGLDEWAVRLPSAVAGLVALWATVTLGARLWSRRAGWIAGWILLTTAGFAGWARVGSADAANLAAVMAAVAWYWARRDETGFGAYLGFYLICALGAHFKGLTAVAVPAAALLPDLARGGRWRRHLNPAHAAALSLGVVAYLLPFLYADLAAGAYGERGLFMAFRENVVRYVHPFDHREPFYVYFRYLPVLLLPWTPLSAGALADMAAGYRRLDPRARWVLEAAGAVFLFFTLSGSRRSYYILPVIPFCALAGAAYLDGIGGRTRWREAAVRLQAGVFAVLAAAEIAGALAWPWIRAKAGWPEVPGLRLGGAAVGTGMLLALWAPRRLRPAPGWPPAVMGLLASAAVAAAGVFAVQQPQFEAFRTEKPFLLGLKAAARGVPPERIGVYGKLMSNLYFYLDEPRPVALFLGTGDLCRFLEAPGPKVIVARAEDLDVIRWALPAAVVERPLLVSRAWPRLGKEAARLFAWRLEGDVRCHR